MHLAFPSHRSTFASHPKPPVTDYQVSFNLPPEGVKQFNQQLLEALAPSGDLTQPEYLVVKPLGELKNHYYVVAKDLRQAQEIEAILVGIGVSDFRRTEFKRL